ncbi:MAG: NCS1 family nucleobase:cation symporter-1 [Blastocatellia bacterium]|nr:NCS1 family nucleobase:cation symporter-1 [Blastocatellia bacterium]
MANESIPIPVAGDSQDVGHLGDDVTSSPLWNADLAPTTAEQRTWSTYHIAALWIGMSVVISTYLLAAGLIEQGMTWWQALMTIFLGNVIVLIPMVLNAHAGTKYGISFPVLCRASFGTRGAHLPATLRAIVACGWFGIQTWIGGQALDALLTAAWAGWQNVPGHGWIGFFVFWLAQVAILWRGIEGIKRLEAWGAPLLLVGGLLLFVWALDAAGGLEPMLRGAHILQQSGQRRPWSEIFWPALTANVGYWATLSLNIPDFTRYASSQRSQILGQALGLPTTMFAFSFLGVAVTSATVVVFGQPIWDPVKLVSMIGSPAVIVFSMLVIMVAQITTNMAANVVAPATGFSNLNPRAISFLTGSLITATFALVMMPWKLMESADAYIFRWLIGYSSLMGALGGILICDYWVIRRRQLSLQALFDIDGVYRYGNGVNWRAVVVFLVAVAPVLPGMLRYAWLSPSALAQSPSLFDQLYTYGWFVTFALSFMLYWALMRGRAQAKS